MHNFNQLSAELFVAAIRTGDRAAALVFGQDIASDPDAANFGVAPPDDYNDEALANLIEENLNGVNKGRVDLTWSCYLPVIVGAITSWVAKELQREDDGKTDREPIE